jgi:hypothetical protein
MSGRLHSQAQMRAQADPLDEDRMGGPHTTRTKTRSQEKGRGRHRADDESLCCRRRATDAACAEDKPRTADVTRRAQTGALRTDGILRVMTRNAALHVVRCARDEDGRGEWQ